MQNKQLIHVFKHVYENLMVLIPNYPSSGEQIDTGYQKKRVFSGSSLNGICVTLEPHDWHEWLVIELNF